MRPKAILFDLYGTLLDIRTEEHELGPWNVLANFLRYRGSRASGVELQQEYFRRVTETLNGSSETHPDIDVVSVFRAMMEAHRVESTPELGEMVAQLFRSLTIRRFNLFPETEDVLRQLAARFRLGLVTDSQKPYVYPELKMLDLEKYFSVITCSAHFGYRKPDPRLFEDALRRMELREDEVVYVGDSTDRDVTGAFNAGIAAVWIRRKGHHGATDILPGVTELPDLRGLLAIGTQP